MSTKITLSLEYDLVYSEDYYLNGSIHLHDGERLFFFWVGRGQIKSVIFGSRFDAEGFIKLEHISGSEKIFLQNYDKIKEECRKLLIKERL